MTSDKKGFFLMRKKRNCSWLQEREKEKTMKRRTEK